MDFPLIFKSALLAGLFAIGYAALAVPTASPNVVFITIDTLRPDHLGCYGDKQIGTPNIDTLAADGTRFERAYTAVPVTLPSHTVIFTGTYPTLSGVHDFAANKLSPTQATLASVLKDNGYTTGAVIGSAVLDSRFGLNHGFDFYYDHFDFNRLQESNLDEMERPGNILPDHTLDCLSKNCRQPGEFGRPDADGARSSKHSTPRTRPGPKPAADHLPEERRQRPQPVCRNFPSAPALQLERIAWSGNGDLSLH